MALQLITGPASEPVTRTEAKAHLRVDHADDDTMIDSIIAAARATCEDRLQRSLLEQTWEKQLDEFPAAIALPRGPVLAITHIKYLAEDGTLTTLSAADYQLDTADAQMAYVLPVYGLDWPAVRDDINCVRVRYTAGYASAAAVPAPIKQWILLRVAGLYEYREAFAAADIRSPAWVDGLLDPYRVVAF